QPPQVPELEIAIESEGELNE
ncbi:MAG: enoyl-CoA hydratase, partial [Enterococcus faecium]